MFSNTVPEVHLTWRTCLLLSSLSMISEQSLKASAIKRTYGSICSKVCGRSWRHSGQSVVAVMDLSAPSVAQTMVSDVIFAGNACCSGGHNLRVGRRALLSSCAIIPCFVCATRPGFVWPIFESAFRSVPAVSYTHLTLPTMAVV